MSDLITVIVPVYKVEIYIRRCVDSILRQTYKNLEIILVDDGSPDLCPIICDEYADMDKRVTVIHKANGGLSDARNVGLNFAHGQYIAFVDSDDYIDERMYEILYKNLTDNNADISVCEFIKTCDGAEIANPNTKEFVEVFNNLQAMENLYNDLYLQTVVAWNKLYKKDIFRSIRYPFGKVNEDEYVIHLILERAQDVVYTNLPLYYYVQRTDSIMGKEYNLKRLDVLSALKERMIRFENMKYNKLYIKAYYSYMYSIKNNYTLVRKNYPEEKDICEKLREDFAKSLAKNQIKFPVKVYVKFRLFLVKTYIYQFFGKCRK
ncbi:MAG: glycosyltransferase family 2 protein [Acidaminococcaceae bacterium]